MKAPTLPTTAPGIMAMTTRDFLVGSVTAGKRLNMYGLYIPAIPYAGVPYDPNGQELFVIAMAVGQDADWLKDTVAARVARSIAAGQGGEMKGIEPGAASLQETELEAKQAGALWAYCRQFIEEQGISCPETIHQTDRVIENAYAFIQGICDLVGYLGDEEEDLDTQIRLYGSDDE